jgi:hypothetical protein
VIGRQKLTGNDRTDVPGSTGNEQLQETGDGVDD